MNVIDAQQEDGLQINDADHTDVAVEPVMSEEEATLDRLTPCQQLVDQGQGQEALDLLDNLALDIPTAAAHTMFRLVRADALRVAGKLEEASREYRSMARRGSEYTALIWRRDAECLMEAKDLSEAMESLRRSLSLNDYDVYAHYLLGQLLFSSTMQVQAVRHARFLLENATDDTMLATAENIYRFAMLPKEAYEVVKRRAQVGEPDAFFGLLLCGAQGILEWDTAESLAQDLESRFYDHGDFATSREIPLYNIARVANEAVNLAVAQETVRAHMDTAPAFDLSEHWTDHDDRIRLGLLSADFASHPVIQLIIGLFEHMDKTRFKLFAYDDGKNEAHSEGRLINVLDKHVDVREQPDMDVAKKVNDDKIDILIDLMGLTTKNRQGVLALRPCPVTATFLGFPGTSGLPSVDYVITDKTITPDSSKPYYAEKLCRLPEVFMPNDTGRLIAANPVCRADVGLPEDKVVFCSFNRSFKLDKNTVHLWMRVLSRVPGSVLWQKADEENMKRVFRETAALHGVDPDRIIFAGNTGSVALHLGRSGLADLGLDTLIYNGHTITADMLWAGVPVVTCRGTHFASRVSASLLQAVGLPELVAESPQEMEDLAVALALNPARLRELRQKLHSNTTSYPLFDTERYTRHFETALNMMVDRAREGLPPDHLDVPALPPRETAFLPDGPPREFDFSNGMDDAPYADMSHTQALQKTPHGIHYGQCPVCNGPKHFIGMAVSVARHPAHLPHMPEQIFWITCPHCAHAYTSSFWDDETQRLLKENAVVTPTVAGIASIRNTYAPVVRYLWERFGKSAIHTGEPVLWLDTCSDDGGWSYTAAGYGFQVTTVNCAPALVERLNSCGLPAWIENPLVSNLSDNPAVVTVNGLEYTPYPDLYIAWAAERLTDNGVLVFSYEDIASPAAHLVGLGDHSPLLANPRRLHLFSRTSLYDMLDRHGFEVETLFADAHNPLGLILVAKKKHKTCPTAAKAGAETKEHA